MQRTEVQPDPVTAEDIAHLPEPAQRYLRFTRVPGHPADLSFHATVPGFFRLRPDRNWLRCTSEQHNDAVHLSRDFRMHLALAHLVPVRATDIYSHGHGRMRATALGLFTLAQGQGPEFDLGELVTFLDDAVLLAPSMLLRLPVEWTAVDEHRFDLSLTDRGNAVTARVTVDDRGAPREVTTRDRWAALPTGLRRTRWSTPVDGWCLVAGRMRPRRACAVWHLPDGPFTYAQFDFVNADITYG
ncbi:DUF6544 family protein [Saccharothrix algeriensis]|uniref:Uncharacterized protein n=1 Tax=Saccharothrix algeriensis TaxID=173560 RepID=A0A8T8I0K0_9PSEU|nr:DUF6544 family protein [Saccharothrix algeriensis]MBM7809706.1 hypothetical protein [Saccharothrix algeriensis]QTR04000.1 hypothetical protein J7S33_03020 [Saccharothrix algeriensis]